MTRRTDTERLDALERHGDGIGLVHDDSWAVGSDGTQNIRLKPTDDLDTTYWVDAAASLCVRPLMRG